MLASLVAFAAMGIDKAKARKKKYRISEAALWTLAWIGGAPGAVCGMFIFRHKTRHTNFRIGLPMLALLQLAIALAIS